MRTAPETDWQDRLDNKPFDRGASAFKGMTVGQYLQAPPFFFTADCAALPVVDLFRGRSCFLICGGPSFADDRRFPKDRLRQPGVLTMGVNNSPRVFRPNLWTHVDVPSNFMRSIWLDPTIMKFSPMCHAGLALLDNDSAVRNGTLFQPNEKWEWLPQKVRDCPNVLFFRRNERFRAEQFLWEDTINWGLHPDLGGNRSVMLSAVRICWLLGIRRIFLLGVDFEMQAGQSYSFDQQKSEKQALYNNQTYQKLVRRFTELQPHFEQAGLQLFNCNPDSQFQVFPHLPYDQALDLVQQQEMQGVDYQNENVRGLYDREHRLGELEKKQDPEQPTALTEEQLWKARRLEAVQQLLQQEHQALTNNKPAPGAPSAAGWQRRLSQLDSRLHEVQRELKEMKGDHA